MVITLDYNLYNNISPIIPINSIRTFSGRNLQSLFDSDRPPISPGNNIIVMAPWHDTWIEADDTFISFPSNKVQSVTPPPPHCQLLMVSFSLSFYVDTLRLRCSFFIFPLIALVSVIGHVFHNVVAKMVCFVLGWVSLPVSAQSVGLSIALLWCPII